MARLILLNGPPGIGKSTLASRLADQHHGMLALDIDVVRSMIGDWRGDPEAGGMSARRLAVAMIRSHLAVGSDVIVPQFLGRIDFVEELEGVARGANADFVEVALMASRSDALEAFADRDGSTDRTHRDAAALVAAAADSATSRDEVLGDMFDRFVAVVDARPATCRVDVLRGDVTTTLARLIVALERAASGE